MIKVLFVCIHNSARSQMAEAFLNSMNITGVSAESAGSENGSLNPLVVDVMKETGIDISGNRSKTVMKMIEAGKKYDYVITVCDQASGERCPVFPGQVYNRLHIEFEDPSKVEGSHEEKLEKIRLIRDQIREKIKEFSKELKIN